MPRNRSHNHTKNRRSGVGAEGEGGGGGVELVKRLEEKKKRDMLVGRQPQGGTGESPPPSPTATLPGGESPPLIGGPGSSTSAPPVETPLPPQSSPPGEASPPPPPPQPAAATTSPSPAPEGTLSTTHVGGTSIPDLGTALATDSAPSVSPTREVFLTGDTSLPTLPRSSTVSSSTAEPTNTAASTGAARSSNKGVIIGGTVGSAALLLVIVLALFYLLRTRKPKSGSGSSAEKAAISRGLPGSANGSGRAASAAGDQSFMNGFGEKLGVGATLKGMLQRKNTHFSFHRERLVRDDNDNGEEVRRRREAAKLDRVDETGSPYPLMMNQLNSGTGSHKSERSQNGSLPGRRDSSGPATGGAVVGGAAAGAGDHMQEYVPESGYSSPSQYSVSTSLEHKQQVGTAQEFDPRGIECVTPASLSGLPLRGPTPGNMPYGSVPDGRGGTPTQMGLAERERVGSRASNYDAATPFQNAHQYQYSSSRSESPLVTPVNNASTGLDSRQDSPYGSPTQGYSTSSPFQPVRPQRFQRDAYAPIPTSSPSASQAILYPVPASTGLPLSPISPLPALASTPGGSQYITENSWGPRASTPFTHHKTSSAADRQADLREQIIQTQEELFSLRLRAAKHRARSATPTARMGLSKTDSLPRSPSVGALSSLNDIDAMSAGAGTGTEEAEAEADADQVEVATEFLVARMEWLQRAIQSDWANGRTEVLPDEHQRFLS